MPLTSKQARELQAKGVKNRLKRRDDWEAYITSGGLRESMYIIEQMLKDGTIDEEGNIVKANVTKTQREGVEMLLKVLPFFKGKRGNVDDKGDTIPQNINILNTTTDELIKLTKGTSNN